MSDAAQSQPPSRPTKAEPAPRTTLPSALRAIDQIAGRLDAGRPSFFLDYDGTLTPIVGRPEDARLGESMRAVLRDLSRAWPVAIVSGRDRRVVQEFVGLDGLVYAGSHGFDIVGPGGLAMRHDAGVRALPALDEAEARLRARLAAVAGAQVERKQFAIAAHFRNVDEALAPDVERAVNETMAAVPGLRRTSGKRVLELRPDVDWDKGRAVLWLLEALGLDGADGVPVFVGDDVTDEDAFRALRVRGVGVFVGEPPPGTHAAYALRDVEEVERFLRALLAKCRPGR